MTPREAAFQEEAEGAAVCTGKIQGAKNDYKELPLKAQPQISFAAARVCGLKDENRIII